MGSEYFTDFAPEELSLVLSIPYRVGVWMSHIDDNETTARDDARENAALKNVLNRIEGKSDKASFISAIISEILDYENVWPMWESAPSAVLDDLPRVLAIVDDRLPAQESALYRKSIFHIAKTVAMAANEGPDAHEDLSSQMFGGKLITKIADWLATKSDDAVPENISPAENAALQRLLHLLKA